MGQSVGKDVNMGLELTIVGLAILVVGAIVVIIALVVTKPRRRAEMEQAQLLSARKQFAFRREWLEAHFLTLAGKSGRPRGLEWSDGEFDNDVAFARDRVSGELRALVGVTISFAAIEGGGMEDVEAVGDLRAATAVFRFDGNEWTTDGRAVFNLNPTETIQWYQNELEIVE
jgi:hypothetical protein